MSSRLSLKYGSRVEKNCLQVYNLIRLKQACSATKISLDYQIYVYKGTVDVVEAK